VVDPDKLRELLAEVSVTDDELAAMFKALVPRPLGKTDPDIVPPVPNDPYVKPGELWLLGDHRMLVGDATDPAAVARLLGGAAPRLLVTDPPYGVKLDPRWRNGVYNALGESAAPYMLSHQNTDISGDTIVDWSPAFELVPSIEVAYVWHAGVHAAAVAAGLARLGLAIRSQIIWVKEHLVISRGDYHWQHEPCWYAVREGRTAGWEGKHDLSTTWELACPKMIIGGSREEKLDHPAQKPLEAMARPIRHHRGDVYEPFVGSGTTLLAAERAGRRCYAMEVEPRYAQMAKERWEAFTGQEATRG
jgi:DNA modification methylase